MMGLEALMTNLTQKGSQDCSEEIMAHGNSDCEESSESDLEG